MTGTALCVAGVVLSTAGYFAGGKDFTYTSDHMYVSGGNSSSRKNLTVMKKEQIDDFTKLNVDFEDFDLDIRTSDDDHYYMEYKLEKNGRKNPLTWKDKDGELTLEESAGGSGSYYITYDLGIFSTHADLTEKKDALNTVVLYIPEKAQLSEAELHGVFRCIVHCLKQQNLPALQLHLAAYRAAKHAKSILKGDGYIFVNPIPNRLFVYILKLQPWKLPMKSDRG